MEFGLATKTNASVAVMGVGYRNNEAILSEGKPPYPNLVDQMVSQGIIESRTYSLYLNDTDSSTAVILFGGVDFDKFNSPLHTLPINGNATGGISRFLVTLTNVSISAPNSKSDITLGPSSAYPLNSLLDSGTSLTYLPSSIAGALAKQFGSTSITPDGLPILPNCNSQNLQGSLNFYFSGVEIRVPYSELILEIGKTNSGGLICGLGVVADDSTGCSVLGDTFLRSAYVVYDLVLPIV